MLQRGQSLIVDNFRMLHAHGDAFLGSKHKRCMWHVWSWTNESLLGLPPDIQPSGEGVQASILDLDVAASDHNITER